MIIITRRRRIAIISIARYLIDKGEHTALQNQSNILNVDTNLKKMKYLV